VEGLEAQKQEVQHRYELARRGRTPYAVATTSAPRFSVVINGGLESLMVSNGEAVSEVKNVASQA
jgi:hypothetical protein